MKEVFRNLVQFAKAHSLQQTLNQLLLVNGDSKLYKLMPVYPL